MIKVTTWRPDTCKCVVEIDWDTDNSESQTHRLITPCEFHLTKNGSDIVSENQLKNKAIQVIAETSADLSKLNDNGTVSPDLNKLSYSFDNDRKLTIISKDKSVDMVNIQDELNAKLGIGKVSIG